MWGLLAPAAGRGGAGRGLGMLTRYSFGWLIVPVAIFLAIFGGLRRTGLAVVAVLAFALVVSPWIARNLAVSGTLFGTAGYAVVEGTGGVSGHQPDAVAEPGPDFSLFGSAPYGHKLLDNLGEFLQGDVFRLGGGWMGILFFAGLLLGLRNVAGAPAALFHHDVPRRVHHRGHGAGADAIG